MVMDAFDPLVEFHANWTAALAERYLPVPWVPPGTYYECVDGHLIMSPAGSSATGYAMLNLAILLRDPARTADCRVYPKINVGFGPQTWLQPDLAVLRGTVKDLFHVPVDDVLIHGEVVSYRDDVESESTGGPCVPARVCRSIWGSMSGTARSMSNSAGSKVTGMSRTRRLWAA
ncbi:MAG: Uma2 family endonuclease [Actinomycetota bacterium]|nr:Uma2 family endonuclease [Actinomycetota bacterium]